MNTAKTPSYVRPEYNGPPELEQEYYAIWDQQKSLGFNGKELENISLLELLQAKNRTTEQLAALLKAYPALQKRRKAGERAEPSSKQLVLPPFDDAAALLQTKLDPPPLLIEGVLHQGLKIVIGGGSKAFKTWCLMSLGHAVATGSTWLDFNCNKARVLFTNFEIPRFFYRERLLTISSLIKTQIETGWLTIWNLRGYACDILTLEAALLERLTNLQFALIVIDPIYKVLGEMDENLSRDMGQIVNALERIASRHNASVVAGAHFSKGNQAAKDPIDRFGGSKIYGADPDVLLTLTPHKEKEAFVADFILRNLPPISSFTLRWVYPRFIRDDTLDVTELKVPKPTGPQAKYKVKQLLECIGTKTLPAAALKKRVFDETGMEKTTFYELLSEAKKMRLIIADDNGCLRQAPDVKT